MYLNYIIWNYTNINAIHKADVYIQLGRLSDAEMSIREASMMSSKSVEVIYYVSSKNYLWIIIGHVCIYSFQSICCHRIF